MADLSPRRNQSLNEVHSFPSGTKIVVNLPAGTESVVLALKAFRETRRLGDEKRKEIGYFLVQQIGERALGLLSVQRSIEVQRRLSFGPRPFPSKVVAQLGPKDPVGLGDVTEGEILFHQLCFLRYSKFLPQLTLEAKTNAKMAKRLNALTRQYDCLRLGTVRIDQLQFKTDPDHFVLIAVRLQAGLDTRSEKDLVDFFDTYCPCRRVHSLSSLSQLRTRMTKAFENICAINPDAAKTAG